MSSKTVSNNKKTFNVAVVGATGAVGMEMVRMLEERSFPVENLTLLASERSAGKTIDFKGKKVSVQKLEPSAIKDLDVAIFSAGGSISQEFAPLFAEKGIFVVDNSSAWRMDPNCPLVVPEVNPNDLSADKKIIANPNCSTIQMVVALKPLHDMAQIKKIRVSTYQAVSGAGGKGIQELEAQTKAWAKGEDMPAPSKFPHQIAFNCLPHIDVFKEDDYTKEELKMTQETKKILGDPTVQVSATCVRVPVFRSHSEAVWIETDKPITPEEAKKALSVAPGITVVDDPQKAEYPLPVDGAYKESTFVGRIRKDLTTPNGLVLWVVSDNLLKGAALNAIQIAELLVSKGFLQK